MSNIEGWADHLSGVFWYRNTNYSAEWKKRFIHLTQKERERRRAEYHWITHSGVTIEKKEKGVLSG